MKTISTILSRLALAALVAGAFAACTTEDAPGTGGGVATNLMAHSLSPTSIALMWTRNANDVSSDTIYVDGVASQTVAAPTSTTTVTVTAGVPHALSVHSTGGSSTALTWMGATVTKNITVWETAGTGSGQPSALQLNGPSGAQAVSSSSASSVDFVLHSISGDPTLPSGISFETTEAFDATYPHVNYIDGAANYIPGGLDNSWRSTPYPDTGTSAAYDLPLDNQNRGSRVLVVRTSDNHTALVEIQQQANGQLYGTSGGVKFVTVNVSYQTVAGQKYAGRPHPFPHFAPGWRSPAH